jgi:RNA polymerase sigma factor (sigma-70 family)
MKQLVETLQRVPAEQLSRMAGTSPADERRQVGFRTLNSARVGVRETTFKTLTTVTAPGLGQQTTDGRRFVSLSRNGVGADGNETRSQKREGAATSIIFQAAKGSGKRTDDGTTAQRSGEASAARGNVQDPPREAAPGNEGGIGGRPPGGVSGSAEMPMPEEGWEGFIGSGQLEHYELQEMLSAVGPEFTKRGVSESEYTRIVAEAGVFLQRVVVERLRGGTARELDVPNVLDNAVLRRRFGALGGETPLARMRRVFENNAERSPSNSPLYIRQEAPVATLEVTAETPAELVDTAASQLQQIAEITEIPVRTVSGITEKHIRRLSIIEGRKYPRVDTEEANRARTVGILQEVVGSMLPADTRFLTEQAVSNFFQITPDTASGVVNELEAQGLLVRREGIGLFVTREEESALLQPREDIMAGDSTGEGIIKPAQFVTSTTDDINKADTVITASASSELVTVEPSPQSIMLAASLNTILGEFRRRGGELEFFQEWRFNGIGEGLMSGEKRGHIESFTGSGKSLDIVLLAAAAMAAGQRVLIVGNTTEDLDTLLGTGGESGMGKFAEGMLNYIRRDYAGRKANDKSPIVATTYKGLLNEYARGETGEGRLGDFDVILGSECHWGLGFQIIQALDAYMPGATKIGFSATPDFADDRRSEEVWGRKWFKYTLQDILKEQVESGREVVAPVRPILVPTDATIRLQDHQNEFTERELAPLIDDPERNGLILQFAQDYIADGRNILIACVPGQENLHAQVLARLLSQMEVNGRPIVAMDYGSHLTQEERRRRLEEYADGRIDALTFTYGLEEAVHISKASVFLDASPTGSERRKKQRLGRIIDKNEDGRESIYVEFVDQTVDGKKQVYSVLNALGLVEVDFTRVIGRNPDQHGFNTGGVSALRPELLDRLMQLYGKELSAALLERAKSAAPKIDSEALIWERTLQILGLPSEIQYNDAFPHSFASAYERQAKRLGSEASHEEIIAAMDLTRTQQTAVGEWGERVPWSEIWGARRTGAVPTENYGYSAIADRTVEERAILFKLPQIMEEAMADLQERDQRLLKLRFGFGEEYNALVLPQGTSGLTFEEIGKIFGITRSRVRDLEKEALAKLRAPVRGRQLLSWLEDRLPVERQQIVYQKRTQGGALFDQLPETQIPMTDAYDPRSYLTRLKEASTAYAAKWYEDQHLALDNQLQSDEALRIVASSQRPVKYRYENSTKRYDADPGGEHVIKVFDKNILRAEAVSVRQRATAQLLDTLISARERIVSQAPSIPDREAGDKKLKEIDARIRSVGEYSTSHPEHRESGKKIILSLMAQRRSVTAPRQSNQAINLAALNIRIHSVYRLFRDLQELRATFRANASAKPEYVDWKDPIVNQE